MAATAAASMPELRSPSCAVRLVDPAAGEYQRAGGEGHALGALDHQQLAARRRAASRTTIRVAAGIGSSLIGARLTCR